MKITMLRIMFHIRRCLNSKRNYDYHISKPENSSNYKDRAHTTLVERPWLGLFSRNFETRLSSIFISQEIFLSRLTHYWESSWNNRVPTLLGLLFCCDLSHALSRAFFCTFCHAKREVQAAGNEGREREGGGTRLVQWQIVLNIGNGLCNMVWHGFLSRFPQF